MTAPIGNTSSTYNRSYSAGLFNGVNVPKFSPVLGRMKGGRNALPKGPKVKDSFQSMLDTLLVSVPFSLVAPRIVVLVMAHLQLIPWYLGYAFPYKPLQAWR